MREAQNTPLFLRLKCPAALPCRWSFALIAAIWCHIWMRAPFNFVTIYTSPTLCQSSLLVSRHRLLLCVTFHPYIATRFAFIERPHLLHYHYFDSMMMLWNIISSLCVSIVFAASFHFSAYAAWKWSAAIMQFDINIISIKGIYTRVLYALIFCRYTRFITPFIEWHASAISETCYVDVVLW